MYDIILLMLPDIKTGTCVEEPTFTPYPIQSFLKDYHIVEPSGRRDSDLVQIEHEIVGEVSGTPFDPRNRTDVTHSFSIRSFHRQDEIPFGELVGRYSCFSPVFLVNQMRQSECLYREESAVNNKIGTQHAEDTISRLPDWALTGYVSNVYVISNHRGKGFGTRLLKESLPALKQSNAAFTHNSPLNLVATTDTDNAAMQHCFQNAYANGQVVQDSWQNLFTVHNKTFKEDPDLNKDLRTVSIFLPQRAPFYELRKSPQSFIPEFQQIYYGDKLTGVVLNSVQGDPIAAPLPGQSVLTLSPDADLVQSLGTIQQFAKLRKLYRWGSVALPFGNDSIKKLSQAELDEQLSRVGFETAKHGVLLSASIQDVKMYM